MDALKDLKWLLVFLVVLWFVWFMTGGPKRYLDSKPFLTPATVGTESTEYGPN